MMMRYVVLRGTIYHYRRRIPLDIQLYAGGQQWWKVTLKTGHARLAELKARRLATEHDRLIAELRNSSDTEKLALLRREDDAYLASEAKRLTNSHMRVSHAVHELSRITFDEMKARASRQLNLLTKEESERISKAGGVQAFYSATARQYAELGQVTDEIEREVRLKHLQRMDAILTKVGFKRPFLVLPDDPSNPRVNCAVDSWLAARKQGESAIKRHKVAMRRFVELHGDVPVRQMSRQMVVSYLDRIENLADHRRLPSDTRGGLADPGPDVPRVSAATVERHLITLKAFLRFCHEKEWVSTNVAAGLSPPRDMRPKASKRRAFSREERVQLLSYAIAECGENSDVVWLIRLGAYTGCRLEELAQLARTNVRSVDGTWIIEIDDLNGRHLKSVSSVKQVPLHPAIRTNFVDWVLSGTGERVFSSFRLERGRYSSRLSGEFGRLMDRAGLPDARLTFHSLRHTLKREMSNARIDPDVRRIILGHAPRDAHDAYEGPSLHAVAEEFSRLPPLF